MSTISSTGGPPDAAAGAEGASLATDEASGETTGRIDADPGSDALGATEVSTDAAGVDAPAVDPGTVGPVDGLIVAEGGGVRLGVDGPGVAGGWLIGGVIPVKTASSSTLAAGTVNVHVSPCPVHNDALAPSH